MYCTDGFRLPGEAGFVSFVTVPRPIPDARKDSYSLRIGEEFPGIKRPNSETDHSFSFTLKTQLRNMSLYFGFYVYESILTKVLQKWRGITDCSIWHKSWYTFIHFNGSV